MQYEWINNVANMSSDYAIIFFHDIFNENIEPNTLPDNLTALEFGYYFNQKIEPNSLPKNLTTVTFDHDFNQKIDLEMLSSSLKNINFNWMCLKKNESIKHYIEMVNNIPNYYHVEIFLTNNIFSIGGPKWPIHAIKYRENEWPLDIYEIQNTYKHSVHGIITILINKETYQPYSSIKSALK